MPKPQRTVLIIDETDDKGNDYEQQLRQDSTYLYQILTGEYTPQSLAIFRLQHVDAILLNFQPPQIHHLNFLKQLTQQNRENCPPIIVIGNNETEIAVEALKNGATDYLIRDRTAPNDLRLALKNAIRNSNLTEYEQEQERLLQKTKAALRESEEFNQRILDSSSDCIKVLTLEGNILYMNKGGLDAIEAENLEAVLNTNWIPRWQGEEREKAKSAIATAREGKSSRFQGFLSTLSGKPKWWDVIVTPLRDVSGQVTKLVVISRDITSHKQAEAALREREEQYRALFNSIDEGFCLFELIYDNYGRAVDWVYLEANPAFERQTGWHNPVGKRVRELQPDLEDLWFETFAQIVATGEPIRFTENTRAMNKWYDVYAFRFGGAESKKVSLVFNDITKRKQAEASLLESEERFRTLADNMSQLAWMADPTGWIFWYNRRWFEYTGTTLEEMQGWGWQQVHHPDHIERVTKKFNHCFQTGKPWEDVFPLRNKEGEYRWFLSRALPIRDKTGKILRWFGTNTDITERKEAEDQLEQLIGREQVAREEAERANRIKDEFLAILSHELRSPLNPILGWAKLLQMRKFNETRTTEALATIERNAKLQAQLIDDLLDVAKILRGKLSLSLGAVNLAFVIEAATETVKAAAMAKSISLQTDLHNIGTVQGDAVRLQQIVWNLLSNAIKFTPRGGQINICLKQVDRYAQFTVRDTGKGISSDFLPYIFESFRQQDASITRQFGGLGLGLAIVRYLVEAHGGTITACSPGEGQGATFTVKFPLLNAEPDQTQTEELLDSNPDLRGVRILAVDDHADTRDLLVALLTQYDAEVKTAASAEEALVILDSFQPDVLISDIGMPEVTGYTLIQKIRALPPERGGEIGAITKLSPKAIALTAYAREEDQKRALDSGYQIHIPKPLDPETLVQAVLKLVR
jgi:PAS domain S-box-containing protein